VTNSSLGHLYGWTALGDHLRRHICKTAKTDRKQSDSEQPTFHETFLYHHHADFHDEPIALLKAVKAAIISKKLFPIDAVFMGCLQSRHPRYVIVFPSA
jgi:hypothetical protein